MTTVVYTVDEVAVICHCCIQAIGMPSPHGDCEPSSDYVQTKCLGDCEANYVISECGCKSVYMPGNLQALVN